MQNHEKEFQIPKNVSPKFEIAQNLVINDLTFFIPSVVIDVPVLFLVPNVLAKIIICAATLMVPFSLVYLRPVRENIPAWVHLVEKHRFNRRQKRFVYRKKVDIIEFIPKKK